MATARKRTRSKVKPKPRAATKRVAKKAAKKAPRVSTHPAKKRTPVSLAIIKKLDKICLALPDATEQIAWGEPTWRVKGKIFAQLDDHHHGAAHVSVWLPAPDGAQQALIDSDPERFFRPPYVGHRGWIAIVLDTDPDWGMVASLVEQAHGMIAGARARS
ncbi:MAG: MmcQ/YjbR family DNA-binding protein [Kofleriaceae bacterium]|nr:MmcQ/YjbR family DNA-binding protein [Kofleriaceae bacterium]